MTRIQDFAETAHEMWLARFSIAIMMPTTAQHANNFHCFLLSLGVI